MNILDTDSDLKTLRNMAVGPVLNTICMPSCMLTGRSYIFSFYLPLCLKKYMEIFIIPDIVNIAPLKRQHLLNSFFCSVSISMHVNINVFLLYNADIFLR